MKTQPTSIVLWFVLGLGVAACQSTLHPGKEGPDDVVDGSADLRGAGLGTGGNMLGVGGTSAEGSGTGGTRGGDEGGSMSEGGATVLVGGAGGAGTMVSTGGAAGAGGTGTMVSTGGAGGIATRPAICGDGKVDPPEQCDDSNTYSGDGCSSECKREPGFVRTIRLVSEPSPVLPRTPEDREKLIGARLTRDPSGFFRMEGDILQASTTAASCISGGTWNGSFCVRTGSQTLNAAQQAKLEELLAALPSPLCGSDVHRPNGPICDFFRPDYLVIDGKQDDAQCCPQNNLQYLAPSFLAIHDFLGALARVAVHIGPTSRVPPFSEPALPAVELACVTDDDCCAVNFGTCGSALGLTAKSTASNIATYNLALATYEIGNNLSVACPNCLAPPVDVTCVAGLCSAEILPATSANVSDYRRAHCGHGSRMVPYSEAANATPDASMPAPIVSPNGGTASKTVFGCGAPA